MSLRRRLLLIIGASLIVLWAAASVWMFIDLRGEFRATLDERLAASARMVANLVSQLPTEYRPEHVGPADGLDIVARQGVACEIRLLQGGLVARTNNSPAGLGSIAAGYSTRTIQGEQWRSFTLQQGGMRITTADRVERRRALLRDIVVAAAERREPSGVCGAHKDISTEPRDCRDRVERERGILVVSRDQKNAKTLRRHCSLEWRKRGQRRVLGGPQHGLECRIHGHERSVCATARALWAAARLAGTSIGQR